MNDLKKQPSSAPRTSTRSDSWTGVESLEPRVVFSAPASVLAVVAPVVAPADVSPATHAADVLYIQKLYNDLLNRAGSDTDVNAWALQIDQGRPLKEVADSFRTSQEYIGHEVDAAYLAILHRASDPIGRAFWVHYIWKDLTIGQFYIKLLTSQEYLGSHSDTTSYVKGLYNDVLGRSATDSEVTTWVQTGYSQTTLANSIVYSTERLTNVIDGYYQQLFDRSPDPSGFNSYAQYILTIDREPTDTLTLLLSSQEYQNRPISSTTLDLGAVGA